MQMLKILKNIYEHFGDDISREIFKNRLMYSISGDSRWILKNLIFVQSEYGKRFLETLEKGRACGEIVIFGAGERGKILYQTTSKYPWKCFIDNYSHDKTLYGLTVMNTEEFLENYKGEYIFITPKKNKDMYDQLIKLKVSENKIFNVGAVLDKLIESIYFGLEYLKPLEEGEIFLDVGGYDGMTSLYFNRWCKKNAFVYIFEPDKNNIKKCYDNLNDKFLNYEIIPKGVWSKTTKIRFDAEKNALSQISDLGQEEIFVTTIDEELSGNKVTFIKMDIEGAEFEALMGAKETIKKNKPKLAISIYHKPEDIWEIPNLILRYNPNYRLYLRHYSLSDYDTVLYALPIEV